ncbi:MAG TPA: carbon monoxide dehydrogenase subunit G [Nakamurella sp.]
MTGSSVLHAPPERVWMAITDPEVLARVIPGCDGLTPLAPERFRLTVTLGVASIKGTYTGEVAFADLAPPQSLTPGSLTLRASGSGAPGTIDTTVAVTLSDLGDATTRIDYDADAVVGGMVGGVGQRVLGAVAKRTADAFFAAIDGTFTAAERSPAAPAAAGSAAARPPATITRTSAGRWELAGATAAGALSMLVGILIGVRIGRRR